MNTKYYHIGSLIKGIALLETIIEQGPLTVTQVANALDINRASTHRLIATLVDLGYLHKNSFNNYEATFKVLQLGIKQREKFDIGRFAKPVMNDLAVEFDETVILALLDRQQVVYIDTVKRGGLLKSKPSVGAVCQPHASALGKAMVAAMPENEKQILISDMVFSSVTSHTITDQNRFKKELAKIRKQRYATENEELCLGLYCVAAPIFDFNGYPSYAIGISGPVISMKRIKSLPAGLLESASKLSGLLGYNALTGNEPPATLN